MMLQLLFFVYCIKCNIDCLEVCIMNNSNNLDMNQLMGMLSKMNKKDLQYSIQKANEIMKSENRDEIINELKKNLNK